MVMEDYHMVQRLASAELDATVELMLYWGCGGDHGMDREEHVLYYSLVFWDIGKQSIIFNVQLSVIVTNYKEWD